ncbi:hypothetical protein J6590_010516 [Homalodisca vitripennis]|nr:hypothetical protein J6590_010516 [Homalodisca vitripennis]
MRQELRRAFVRVQHRKNLDIRSIVCRCWPRHRVSFISFRPDFSYFARSSDLCDKSYAVLVRVQHRKNLDIRSLCAVLAATPSQLYNPFVLDFSYFARSSDLCDKSYAVPL